MIYLHPRLQMDQAFALADGLGMIATYHEGKWVLTPDIPLNQWLELRDWERRLANLNAAAGMLESLSAHVKRQAEDLGPQPAA